MKSTLKSFNESESRLPSLAKSSANGLDLTLSATKTASPLEFCFAVADFWKEIGSMSKTDALVQLEKFFYQGLKHKGVQLPAAINFAHYTHGTGQVLMIVFKFVFLALAVLSLALESD
jgi:hypothetical protein